MTKFRWAWLAAATALVATPGMAQDRPAPPDHHAAMAAQADAMAPFAWMAGRWRGHASQRERSGEINLVQTERVGPMLSGSVVMVEGRGYDPATGKVEFNAFGVIVHDPATGDYHLDAIANGQHGHFPIALLDGGFDWFIEQGPVKIRYETRLVDGQWVETGFVAVPGREEMQFFKMTLDRIGDSDWPASGIVPMEG